MLTLFGVEQVYQFKGAYDHEITLTLFPRNVWPAGHVVVLAFFRNQLVFTKHHTRGLEWPGGKVEEGESPLEAAIRELREETGGVSQSMWLVGQYEVIPALEPQGQLSKQEEGYKQAWPDQAGKEPQKVGAETELSLDSFVKNIYVAVVDKIEEQHTGTDTLGYALVPINLQPTVEEGFSPLVLDAVFEYVRREVVLNPSSIS